MTTEQLIALKGKPCRFRHGDQDWRHGIITAVMSEVVSIDGYPFTRDGLEVQPVNGSREPLEQDMTAVELSSFLDEIHQRYDGDKD